MKQTLHLAVTNPCHEDWQQMTPTERGRHCASCNKVVVDFAAMSTPELLAHFKNTSGNVCGRFRQEQLTTYTLPSESFRLGWRPVAAALGIGVASILSQPAHAQTLPDNPTPIVSPQYHQASASPQKVPTSPKTIRGVIRDEDGLGIPGANVGIAGTTHGVATDLDGRFALTLPPEFAKAGTLIQVLFLGYEPLKIVLTQQMLEGDSIDQTLTIDTIILGGACASEVPITTPWERYTSFDYWVNRGWDFLRWKVFGWI